MSASLHYRAQSRLHRRTAALIAESADEHYELGFKIFSATVSWIGPILHSDEAPPRSYKICEEPLATTRPRRAIHKRVLCEKVVAYLGSFSNSTMKNQPIELKIGSELALIGYYNFTY